MKMLLTEKWSPLLIPAFFATVIGTACFPQATDGQEKTEIRWHDVRELTMEGQGWSETKSPYDRLPARAEELVRPPVWRLSQHSAGLCVRFKTASPQIRARWTLTSETLAMNHMPATGVSGLDLYVQSEDQWRWLATGRPSAKENTATLVQNLSPQLREYCLYLPLYNGVSSVEIGVPADQAIEKLPRSDDTKKPIVFWGTSITQGGCASRTGMVHTAILGRRLDLPVINLGFSGNGRMEPEVAKLIAEIDAALYVVDCLPNLNHQQVAERTVPLVKILREARPETPILLVEDRSYSSAFLVDSLKRRNRSSRKALREAYQQLLRDGVSSIYYLTGDGQLGDDNLGTVDGSHPTDLGFLRMADFFEPVLASILNDSPGAKFLQSLSIPLHQLPAGCKVVEGVPEVPMIRVHNRALSLDPQTFFFMSAKLTDKYRDEMRGMYFSVYREQGELGLFAWQFEGIDTERVCDDIREEFGNRFELWAVKDCVVCLWRDQGTTDDCMAGFRKFVNGQVSEYQAAR